MFILRWIDLEAVGALVKAFEPRGRERRSEAWACRATPSELTSMAESNKMKIAHTSDGVIIIESANPYGTLVIRKDLDDSFM